MYLIWRLLNVILLFVGMFLPFGSGMYGGSGYWVLTVTILLLPGYGFALCAWVVYGLLSVVRLISVIQSNPDRLLGLRIVALFFSLIFFVPFATHEWPFLFVGMQLTLVAFVSSWILELVLFVQHERKATQQ